MRRKDREVADADAVFAIVDECRVAHVAMVDADGRPYVVPLNFGYERDGDDLVLYFHCAREGKKLDILRHNPNVFVAMERVNEVGGDVDGNPCKCYQNYASVMGRGTMAFLDDAAGKAHALNRLIAHATHRDGYAGVYSEAQLRAVCVLSVRLREPSGKRRG